MLVTSLSKSIQVVRCVPTLRSIRHDEVIAYHDRLIKNVTMISLYFNEMLEMKWIKMFHKLHKTESVSIKN